MNGERFAIGVMIGNANSPHIQTLMDGIHQAAIRENVDVLYFLGVHSAYYSHAYFGDSLSENYDYQFNIVYDYASLEKIDALIIDFGSLVIYNNVKKNDFLERFKHIPQVLLEDTDETGKRSVIINDNYSGMKQIVTHLICEHKCRSFTYLSGPPNNTDSDQRRQAFLDTLKEYDIPFDMSRMETGMTIGFVNVHPDYFLLAEKPFGELIEGNDPVFPVLSKINQIFTYDHLLKRTLSEKGFLLGA